MYCIVCIGLYWNVLYCNICSVMQCNNECICVYVCMYVFMYACMHAWMDDDGRWMMLDVCIALCIYTNAHRLRKLRMRNAVNQDDSCIKLSGEALRH